jgi:hypothetical protein
LANGKDYELTEEGNIKVGPMEYKEYNPGHMVLHYQEYYDKLDKETQKLDDYSWLEVMELDEAVTKQQLEDHRRMLDRKWAQQ